jgi:hypothetical protein
MLYRIRRYAALPEKLAAFHDFFNGYLLPIQVRHGARLVGRWETDDEEVIAVWEYDDMAAYERIDRAVRADPDSVRAQEQRNTVGPLLRRSMKRSPAPPSIARVRSRSGRALDLVRVLGLGVAGCRGQWQRPRRHAPHEVFEVKPLGGPGNDWASSMPVPAAILVR